MKVLFVAPLPPPLHGFSNINAAFLSHIKACSDVSVFDRAREGPLWFIAYVRMIFKFFYMAAMQRKATVYIALSGGLGKWLDMPIILLTCVFRLRLFVHHHSYAYLNVPDITSQLCLGLVRSAHHIVLCGDMSKKLACLYQIPLSKISIQSNAAFLDGFSDTLLGRSAATNKVKIGYFSSVSPEKGVLDFLNVVERARGLNLCVDAEIAGAIPSQYKTTILSKIYETFGVSYLGPLAGAEKVKFLESLDFLIFPTNYANEAEPVAVLEALTAGARVLAKARGCLCEMLCSELGGAVDTSSFSDLCISEIVGENQKSQCERNAERALRINIMAQRKKAEEASLRQLLVLIGSHEKSSRTGANPCGQ